MSDCLFSLLMHDKGIIMESQDLHGLIRNSETCLFRPPMVQNNIGWIPWPCTGPSHQSSDSTYPYCPLCSSSIFVYNVYVGHSIRSVHSAAHGYWSQRLQVFPVESKHVYVLHPVWITSVRITYKGSSFTWVSKMVVAGVELWRSQYMGKLSVPRKHGSSSQVVTLQGWSHGHVTLTVLSQVIAYHTFQVSTY